jgi:PAS domain-containing protein
MMKISLDPIVRPAGYVVLRGTEMNVHERMDRQFPPEDITRSIEQVIEEMPCGVYKVSAAGSILAVNPAFEAMLGYAPTELLMHRAKFADIVFEGFGDAPFQQRWEGNVAFRNSNGKAVRLHLTQILTPNQPGKDPIRLGFVMPARTEKR